MSKKKDQAAAPEDDPRLEPRLKRLETILGKLESDDVELDQALTLFEEGVLLVRDAERILSRAEAKVDELLSDGETRPLEEEDEA